MTPAKLAIHLDNYLQLRRAIGFPMIVQERLLRDFVAIDDLTKSIELNAHLAVAWARSRAATCSRGYQVQRLSVVRGFLVYLSSFEPGIQVPERGLLRGAVRPKPHIYSEREIQTLLTAARSLKPGTSLRPHTIETLIGLLVSTGLRAGEALRLRDEDVVTDREPPRLYVLQTKFRKSRIVPVHPSTAEALLRYRQRRGSLSRTGDFNPFFVSLRGTALARRTISGVFLGLVREVGLHGPTGTRGPSLHALRHTFAVNRLLAWYRSGCDVQKYLPNLAVYLGHIRQEETYWYLTATPELLRAAADRFETFAQPEDA